MWYFFTVLFLYVTIELIQADDKKNSFVDIRSVYHVSNTIINREHAIQACKNYSSSLVSLDHYQEFVEVTGFFGKTVPASPSGDGIRIQTSATRNLSSPNIRLYQWNYQYKSPREQTIFNWCNMFGILQYPLDIPDFNCLMLSMDKTEKWCYKNYDCNDHLQFMCERKITEAEATALEQKISGISGKSLQPSARKRPNPCVEGKYTRYTSTYLLFQEYATYDQSILNCQKKNGHLVNYETRAELDALAEFILKCRIIGHFYSSGTRKNKTSGWTWGSNGDPINYSKWCEDQPDDQYNGYNYMILYFDNINYCFKSSWASFDYNYICEIETK